MTMASTPVLRIGSPDGWREIPIESLVEHPDLIRGGAAVVDRRGDAVPVRAIIDTDLPWVSVTSDDGTYRATIPAEQLLGGGLLLIGTSAEPLGEAEGGPVRLVVSEGSTLCWNVKFVSSIEATVEPLPDSIPENPSH